MMLKTDMTIIKEIHVQYSRQAIVNVINAARQIAHNNLGKSSEPCHDAMMTARIDAFTEMAHILGLSEYLKELSD